jgi:Skp family chaperone for outer membrane proteins
MSKVWNSLGTQRAVRVISLLMVLYLVVIGFLVFGYARVSSCLADYADRSAVSQTARAEAAAQDRQLDLAERDLDESDRLANREFAKALSAVLSSFNATKAEQKQAYFDLLEQDKKTSAQLDSNEKNREAIKRARVKNEAYRKSHPVPPPPSESC